MISEDPSEVDESECQFILPRHTACINATGLLEKSLNFFNNNALDLHEGHHNCTVMLYNFDITFTCATSFNFFSYQMRWISPVIVSFYR